MKTVLIVDTDAELLDDVAQRLSQGPDGIITRTASSGHDAVELLVSEQIDLLIAAPGIAVRDDVELLTFAHAEFPGVMLMAMIELQTSAHDDDDWGDVDGVVCVNRPPPDDELQHRVGELLTDQICGHIEHLGLGALLQLIEMERKSCAITVASEARIGRLYINKGRLVAAQSDSNHGQEAAIDIATWPDPEIDIERLSHIPAQTIEAPLSFIIMESARLSDERQRWRRAGQDLPPLAEGTPTHLSRVSVAALAEGTPPCGTEMRELWDEDEFALDVIDDGDDWDRLGDGGDGGGGGGDGGDGGGADTGDGDVGANAKVQRALAGPDLAAVCDGVAAVVVIDAADPRCVAAVGSEAIPDPDAFANACAHSVDITRIALTDDEPTEIDDIIITSADHHCLLRPVTGAGGLIAAMLVLRREGMHLAAARRGLRVVAEVVARAADPSAGR